MCRYVNSLENAEKRSHAISIIESMEEEANHKLKLQPGLQELLSFLEENQVNRQSSLLIIKKLYKLFEMYDPYTHTHC